MVDVECTSELVGLCWSSVLGEDSTYGVTGEFSN